MVVNAERPLLKPGNARCRSGALAFGPFKGWAFSRLELFRDLREIAGNFWGSFLAVFGAS
jgi:hypothetical protein